MNCTLGFDFDCKDPATPFAVQNFVQPLFVFVFMIVQAQIKTKEESEGATNQYLWYFVGCFGYACIAIGIMMTF